MISEGERKSLKINIAGGRDQFIYDYLIAKTHEPIE